MKNSIYIGTYASWSHTASITIICSYISLWPISTLVYCYEKLRLYQHTCYLSYFFRIFKVTITDRILLNISHKYNRSCVCVCNEKADSPYFPRSWVPQAGSEVWEVYRLEVYYPDDPPRPWRSKAGQGLVMMMMRRRRMMMMRRRMMERMMLTFTV